MSATNNKEFAIKIIKHKKKLHGNSNKGKFGVYNPKECIDTNILSESCWLEIVRGFGIPKLRSFGYNSNYDLIIMELLGQSLNDLFKLKNKKFSIKTTCMLGIQMIDRIEYIHSLKIIHRNLKPNSFIIGKNSKSHILFLSDFCLAKKYWQKNAHIKFIKEIKFLGVQNFHQ